MNFILEKLASLTVFLVSGLEDLFKTDLAFIKANWADALVIIIAILISALIGAYIDYYHGFKKPVRKGVANGSIRVIPQQKIKKPKRSSN